MKQSIFLILLICGFAFQNCRGQSENEQNKVGTFNLELVPLEAQMPDTIPASELKLTQRKKITIKIIDKNYFLDSHNSLKRLYEDSILNREYLGLSELDTIFNATFIFDEFPNWFVGNKNIPIIERLRAVGMTESFNLKVSQKRKDQKSIN
jgi:hypothetical protein